MSEQTIAKPVYEHALSLYTELSRDAKLEDYHGTELLVFRGKIKDAYGALGISMGHYSRIMSGLTNSGSVSMLQRGARNIETVLVLHHSPEPSEWAEADKKDLTGRVDSAILAQRVEDLRRRLGDINLVEVLQEFERRLLEVERLAKPM